MVAARKKAAKAPVNPRGIENLLWGEREKPKRGPKPGLTPDQIAREAVRVADAEGLAAVSMQRIAQEVGVTTMALYRYFSSKAELVSLMIDSQPVPDLGPASKGWRSRLMQWTRQCSAIYRNHPWFLEATTARARILGPNELSWFDAALAALAETGLPAREQHKAFLVLIGYVRSHAEYSAGAAQGSSTEKWASTMAGVMDEKRGRFPALMAAMEAGAFQFDREDGLDFGLECILDGIEAQAAKRAGKSRRRNRR